MSNLNKSNEKIEYWEIQPQSEINLINISKLLPLCPKPFSDESLYSWILRVARKNMDSIGTIFIKDGRRIRKPRQLDNLLSQFYIDVIKEKTGMSDKEIINLTTRKWNTKFPEYHVKSLKSFSSKLKICPICLKEDEIPYFRLEYKLKLLNTCPKHNCLVINKCPFCNSELKPHILKHTMPIYRCYKCNADLRQSKPIYIYSGPSNKTFESQIRLILQMEKYFLIKELNLAPKGFIEIAYQLSSFLIHAYEITDELFKNKLDINLEKYKEDWNQLKRAFSFLKNPVISYLLLETTFSLLVDNEKLSSCIKNRQSKFNLYMSLHRRCHPMLKKYRVVQEISRTLQTEKIKKAINKLQMQKKPVNKASITRESGIFIETNNSERLQQLEKLIEEANEEEISRLEEKIRNIIKSFEQEDEVVSVEKVTRKLNVGSSKIYNSPRLAKLINPNLKTNPLWVKKIYDALDSIKKEQKTITFTEIIKKTKIPSNIIRRNYQLREIIITAKKNAKHPKFNEFKEKLEMLKKSEKILDRDLIVKEIGIRHEIINKYPELKKLYREALGDKISNLKKRLLKSWKSLERKEENLSIKSISKEARMAETTVRKYKVLHKFIKDLILKSDKKRLKKAYNSLKESNGNISLKSILKEANIARSVWNGRNRDYELENFKSNNIELYKFIKDLINS